MEETLDALEQDGLSDKIAGKENLTLGLLKFFGGWLVFTSLAAVLPEWSYSILDIFVLSLAYLVLVLPVYLRAAMKLVFSPGKAAMAVLLFYFLLFVCWGLWNNNSAEPTVNYLVSSIYDGIGAAALAGSVMISKKVVQVLVVAPFALAARLGRLLLSIGRKN